MTKLDELITLFGSREAAEEFLRATKSWSDELQKSGIKFKGIRDAQAILSGLSKKELKALLDLIGLILRDRTTTATDKHPLKPRSKTVKLTYQPDEVYPVVKESVFHPPADKILGEKASEGIDRINLFQSTMEKGRRPETALDRDFAEGMAAIMDHREERRKLKGGTRLSKPDWQITVANVKALMDISPVDRTAAQGIAVIEEYRRRRKAGC